MSRILVVDDEERVMESIRSALDPDEYECHWVENGIKALTVIEEQEFDLVLTDLMMPKVNGLDVVRSLRAKAPKIPIIVMTAYGSIDIAVEAMRLGAEDFLSKPLERSRLRKSVERVLQAHHLEEENLFLKGEIDRISGVSNLVGRSPAFKEVLSLASQVAKSDGTVLITGETGTGKELLARTIHSLSARSPNPFVVVNCVALAPSLLESELFGHEKGAFTGALERKRGRFEMAAGGTIFLDEIGEIDDAFQMRLLRFLQEKEFERVGGIQTIKSDVRVIAATHRNLERLVKEGKIRSDLFYRLNVLPIHIPSLKERLEDVIPLVEHFMKHYSQMLGRKVLKILPEARAFLLNYSWPGNIRELRNVIERGVALDQDGILGLDDLSIRNVSQPTLLDGNAPYRTLEECREYHTERHIRKILQEYNGDKEGAAKALGVSRMTLYRLLRKYAIEE